jgi:hypothetical protein
VLDSKPVLRTEFPTLMYQYGDGRMVDTHVPNPGYDAKSVARDRLNYDITQGKKAAWKETQYTDTVSGSTMWIDGNTGRQAWTDPVNPGTKAPGPLLSEIAGGGKPAAGAKPATAPAPVVQPPAVAPDQKPAATGQVVPGPIPGRATPTTSAVNPIETITEADPDDPLNPGRTGIIRRPNPGVATQNQKHYDGIMKDVRTTNIGAEQALGQLTRLEAELAKLPKNESLLSAGPGADKRKEIARWINWTLGAMGMPPRYDPNVVGAMEASFKDSTIGGFMQSRLTGGGQHNAAPIIQASMKAFPGAEMTPQGARIIIAANKEAAQRERDHYAFMTNPKNIKAYNHDADAMEAAFFRYNPAEMYVARAALSVIPKEDIAALKSDPRAAAAFERKYPGIARWVR